MLPRSWNLIEALSCELREATTARAELLVRVRLSDTAEQAQSLQLSGNVSGPDCEVAHTLRCQYPLQAVAGEPLHLRASVPDPCYWTAELPMLYEVVVELSAGGQVVASHREKIGLQRPAVRTIDELGLN